MNVTLISQAILLPLFWLFSFLFITSVGLCCRPFKRHAGVLSQSIFTWFWYGIGITVAYLQIWNLFLPVSVFTWLCLLPVAMFGMVQTKKHQCIVVPGKPQTIVLVVLTAIVGFLVLSSLNNLFIYDTLVYHFYNIKWCNTYPVTPGMANLFSYLGVNQSYFLFSALLNSLWTHYRGACATNGLLAVVVCAEIIATNAKHILNTEKLSFASIFQLLFLPLCINAGVQTLSSPTPDVFVNLLTFKIMVDLIRCTEAKTIGFQDVFLLGFYGVLGIVMKLSFIGIALGIVVVIVIMLCSKTLGDLKAITKAVVVYIVLFVPWLVRGIISSGYIGFPLSFIALPVDWKMPKAAIDLFAAYVTGFARTHEHGQAAIDAASNYRWLPGWCHYFITRFGFVVPTCLCIASFVYLKVTQIRVSKLLFILLPIFIAIVFWFCTAPDIRFAVNTFWTLGLAPVAFIIYSDKTNWTLKFSVCISICCFLIMIRNWNTNLAPLGDVPTPVVSVVTTTSGLQINTIKGTPPNDDWRLGDCMIPCSVYPDANLVLRGTTIQEGFNIANK